MRLIILALAVSFCVTGLARAGDVGFQELKIPNGDEPPLTIGVGYPTHAKVSPQRLESVTQVVAPDAPVVGAHLPLVVISHGSGGSFAGHYDTALALANAGFVAAAVTHTGDSYDAPDRAVEIWRRPAQLEALIDYMLSAWPQHGQIDVHRLGVFGFSAGGFTALVAAGGVPDLRSVTQHCAAHPTYFDCQIVSRANARAPVALDQPASVWVHDARVRAAVVAAPALGFSFGKAGLAGVRVPVQLWRSEFDHILPIPDYADAVNADLPVKPEFHLAPNADHFDFLAPCSEGLAQHAPDICLERPGFDRAAFHARFDAEVVRFFKRTLK